MISEITNKLVRLKVTKLCRWRGGGGVCKSFGEVLVGVVAAPVVVGLFVGQWEDKSAMGRSLVGLLCEG